MWNSNDQIGSDFPPFQSICSVSLFLFRDGFRCNLSWCEENVYPPGLPPSFPIAALVDPTKTETCPLDPLGVSETWLHQIHHSHEGISSLKNHPLSSSTFHNILQPRVIAHQYDVGHRMTPDIKIARRFAEHGCFVLFMWEAQGVFWPIHCRQVTKINRALGLRSRRRPGMTWYDLVLQGGTPVGGTC